MYSGSINCSARVKIGQWALGRPLTQFKTYFVHAAVIICPLKALGQSTCPIYQHTGLPRLKCKARSIWPVLHIKQVQRRVTIPNCQTWFQVIFI